jgi:tetratricopeptide (TPR) repeat protein
MEKAAALAKGKPGAEDWITHSQALVLARSGQLQQARATSRRAIDLALQTGQRERAASYEVAAGVYGALLGSTTDGRQRSKAALNLSTGRDVEYSAAFALALSGEVPRAQTLANDLEKRFPEDSSVQFEYLPTLRAIFALDRKQPEKAIELLQTALPHELSVPAIDFNFFFGGLYSAYVHGQAYLAMNNGTNAAAEFQKILDHRGLIAGDPVGALARLQLGRAYANSGDTVKAKAAYQDLLAVWKNADPDLPILKHARAEYAKLR